MALRCFRIEYPCDDGFVGDKEKISLKKKFRCWFSILCAISSGLIGLQKYAVFITQILIGKSPSHAITLTLICNCQDIQILFLSIIFIAYQIWNEARNQCLSYWFLLGITHDTIACKSERDSMRWRFTNQDLSDKDHVFMQTDKTIWNATQNTISQSKKTKTIFFFLPPINHHYMDILYENIGEPVKMLVLTGPIIYMGTLYEIIGEPVKA